jgi:diguanylate cyclase (GGDEF)-like protein/PAS domain S-box-containing protein
MRSLGNLPLDKKIVSIILAATILILSLSGAAFLIYDYFSAREELRDEIAIIANIVALRSAAAVSFDDRNNATSNLETLDSHNSIRLACIYKRDLLFSFHVRKATGEPGCNDSPPMKSGYRYSRDLIELATPISLGDNNIGTLYIAATTDRIGARMLYMALAATTFLLMAGTIALAVSSRLIRLAITPLSKLTEIARQITHAGEYSVRARKIYQDDVGELVDAFNTMLETIENQNSALRDSEEKLRAIITDAPDLIEIVDREGNIRFANHAEKLVTKCSNGETTPNLFDDLSPEHREQAVRSLNKVFETGATTQFEAYDQEQDCWYSNHLGPLRDNGQIKSALVLRRDISPLKKAHDQLHQIAFYDPLTSLPNRRLFRDRLNEELARCRTRGSRLALMFLDLDDFKRINDTLGHDAGDKLLLSIAVRLCSCVRHEDMVSRLGGDEFTVLVGGLNQLEPVEQIANKILEKLRQPIDLGKDTLRATVSIGIAIAPDHGLTLTELMQHADIAMYEAKAKGKNNFQMFDISHLEQGIELLKFESELRDALINDEFRLLYQPQIDLATGAVIGIEALIRWQHPTRGLLRPSSFIARAEELGLLKPLSKWTLYQACREIQNAAEQNSSLAHIKLAVNLSARQFKDPELITFIRNLVQETGFDPHRLEFEITETTLITDVEASVETMLAMRELGITLSIDDFGTGYASLNYLKRLPVDCLKIDGSFIRDIPHNKDDVAITTAVIAMAHNLDIKALAEGVQNGEQLEFLKQNGCDYAQGYLIGPPLPVDALIQLINR